MNDLDALSRERLTKACLQTALAAVRKLNDAFSFGPDVEAKAQADMDALKGLTLDEKLARGDAISARLREIAVQHSPTVVLDSVEDKLATDSASQLQTRSVLAKMGASPAAIAPMPPSLFEVPHYRFVWRLGTDDSRWYTETMTCLTAEDAVAALGVHLASCGISDKAQVDHHFYKERPKGMDSPPEVLSLQDFAPSFSVLLRHEIIA